MMNRRKFLKSAAIASGLIYVPRTFAQSGEEGTLFKVPTSGATNPYNVVSSWHLDESSGNAADSFGSVTLTNNGTVTYVAGKINNGANTVALSSQSLSATNPVTLHLPTGFTVCAWAKPADVVTATHVIVSKFINGNPGYELDMSLSTNTNMRALVSLAGGGNVSVRDTVNLSAGTWYFACMTWDGTTLKISTNAGTQVTTALSGSISAETNNFLIGARGDGLTFSNAVFDEVVVANRAWTTSEITAVYNGGTGIQLP